MKTYCYCRISRATQKIDRQINTMLREYPNGIIIKEVYTGTKVQGRVELDKLIKKVKKGDCIVFDSASRMSRNEKEAMELYELLFNKGVDLVFIKEPNINTAVYKEALEKQISINAETGNEATDVFIENIIKALNEYTIALAKEQIKIVFQQAQKEADDLHIRVAEGIANARDNGKQIGNIKGSTLNIKKKEPKKQEIAKYSRDFDGTLTDSEVMKLINLSRNTYYKYKKEVLAERLEG